MLKIFSIMLPTLLSGQPPVLVQQLGALHHFLVGEAAQVLPPPRGRTPSLAEQRLAEQRHRDCGTATARRSALAYAYCTRGAPLLCIVLHSASMRLSCRHVAVTDCLSRVPYLLK